ncbi:MAG: hypothetical protein COB67_00175 [SAR324 cluster bacterium]|uniref:Uncharacterized protein n=1 Tax=SAR324 cluster bacterium TaxID=2024889 RepID=A0A2A4TCQ6_9DELT|nr:MAG: hypothetical protein COB67_00175 [SAR324 cluster bacterium]
MNETLEGITIGDIVKVIDTPEKFSKFAEFFVELAIEDIDRNASNAERILPIIRDSKYKSYSIMIPFLFFSLAKYMSFLNNNNKAIEMQVIEILTLDDLKHKFGTQKLIVNGVFESMYKLVSLNEYSVRKNGGGIQKIVPRWFALSVFYSNGMAKELMILPCVKGAFQELIDVNGLLEEVIKKAQVNFPVEQKAFGSYQVSSYWESERVERKLIRDWN